MGRKCIQCIICNSTEIVYPVKNKQFPYCKTCRSYTDLEKQLAKTSKQLADTHYKTGDNAKVVERLTHINDDYPVINVVQNIFNYFNKNSYIKYNKNLCIACFLNIKEGGLEKHLEKNPICYEWYNNEILYKQAVKSSKSRLYLNSGPESVCSTSKKYPNI